MLAQLGPSCFSQVLLHIRIIWGADIRLSWRNMWSWQVLTIKQIWIKRSQILYSNFVEIVHDIESVCFCCQNRFWPKDGWGSFFIMLQKSGFYHWNVCFHVSFGKQTSQLKLERRTGTCGNAMQLIITLIFYLKRNWIWAMLYS